MIKIKSTKQKIASTIKVVEETIKSMYGLRDNYYYRDGTLENQWDRMQINAHIFIMREFSMRLRSKYIMMENKLSTSPVQLSVDENTAYVFILHTNKGMFSTDYESLVVRELQETITKHLLN